MRKRTALFAVLAVFAATFAAGGPLSAQTSELETRDAPERLSGGVSDAFEVRSLDDVIQVFIQLDEPSVSEVAADGAGRAAQLAQGDAVRAQQDRVLTDVSGLIDGDTLANLVIGANGFRARVRLGDIPAIRALDGVKSVAPVTLYYPTNETSVPWIGGTAAQDAGLTGAGIDVAIIDTGIDYNHSQLGGSGDPADYAANDPTVIESGTFPTARVVGGYDFAGVNYDASTPGLETPDPDPDPLDVNGHGSHVAGTAAGTTGMAPAANLWALKVFGDVTGSTDLVADALEFALDPNGDGAIDDAVDVVNMSLGSPYGHPEDPSAIASQNAVDNGIVVVASAGNEGPNPYVTGSPAVASDVISVAASADGGVTALAARVNSPDSVAGDYLAQPGDFGDLTPPTTGNLGVADPLDACLPLTNDLSGQIAFLQRGTCEFSLKVRNAQDAGAIGALVFNNVEGPPIAMGQGAEPPGGQPTIPAMMIGLADGEAILAAINGGATVNVTLSEDILIPQPELADTLASFTSRGPGFGNTFKPDVSAPGFNINSADVGSGDGTTLNSGTSMAAPHVAGAAAQLLSGDASLTPAQVKGVLMATTTPALPAPDVPVARQGTGVIHVDVAANQSGYASPGGLVFRLNPTAETTETQTVDINRLTGDDTYQVTIESNQSLPGVTWSASAASVTTSGGSGSIGVSVTADPAAMNPDDGFMSQSESDGWLVLTGATETIRVGLVAVADPASTVSASGELDNVVVANGGPSLGFADGFTSVSGAGAGLVAEVGYKTASVPPAAGGPYDTITFGVALGEPWSSVSGYEVDLYLDTNQDGTDEYALVMADLGFLLGGDPTSQPVTALFDLTTGGAVLLYFATADYNDHVAVMPADLTGAFGFLADGDTNFNITPVVFDALGSPHIGNTVGVDLTTEITATGLGQEALSFALDAGVSGNVPLMGAGDMLWLFQNNVVSDQFALTTVTSSATPPPPPPPPPGEPPSFVDVPEDHLFYTEITWLAEQGITRGCNPPVNDRFCPSEPVNRGQMAAFLNRALDLTETTVDFFTDDEGNIFEVDINELAASGITKGCNPPTNDNYCAGDNISRAQMATFMVRGFGFTDGAGSDLFVDDDGNIHEGAIDILGTSSVTRGCNPPANDQFCPDADINRGQMAAFIYRAYQTAGLDDGS